MADRNMTTTIARERVESLVDRHGEPDWLRRQRLSLWEQYLLAPPPAASDSLWKRTDISSLDLSALTTLDIGQPGPDAAPEWFAAVRKNNQATAGLLFQSTAGQPQTQLSPELADRGVIFCALAEALKKYPERVRPYLESAGQQNDKYSLLNQSLFNCGLFLYVPDGLEIESPFLSGIGLHRASPAGGAIFPRIIVAAGYASSLKLISVLGADDGSDCRTGSPLLFNCATEIHAAAGARVSHVEIESFGPDVFAINRTANTVEGDASLNSLFVALGCRANKCEIATRLVAPGASSSIYGLVLGVGEERFNFNTIQEHAAPDTRSNINFRVALKDAATSTYQGKVRVDKAAQKTDAFQSNKNLLLGERARADSIPNLEILADDVKCSHGATVGPVDREQLFYLMSRGLAASQAEELIVLGFFRQVLSEFSLGYGAGRKDDPGADIEWIAGLISRKLLG